MERPGTLTEDQKLQLCLERDRLLCDVEFARSPTMSKLLRFLVSHRLSDSDRPLKGYSIAVDALGRADGFDAQLNSYPRVQMGRLRRLLDHFYLRNGGENRLTIPHNRYEILLVPNKSGKASDDTEQTVKLIDKIESAPSNTRSIADPKFKNGVWSTMPVWFVIVLSTVLFLIAIVGFTSLRPEKGDRIAYPAIIVPKTEGIASNLAQSRVAAIRNYLLGALQRFDQVRVYDTQASGSESSQYLLEISNLDESARTIQLRLVDSRTSEVIWTDRVELVDTGSMGDDLGKEVIAIAGPHGVIARNELIRYGKDYSIGYPCLLQFHQYLRYRDRNGLNPVLECIDKSSKRFPDDAYMLSMLAVAKDVSKGVGSTYAIEGLSEDIAQRAVKLDNRSASATFAVAQSAFVAGDCLKGVTWGKRAAQLNPLNSGVTGYLGLYMLACKMPEGEEYAEKALKMDPNADLVVAAMLAFQKLKRGDAMGARALSLQYMAMAEKVEPGLELTYILSTAKLGDKPGARQAWRRLTARYGLPETVTPRQLMHRWIANPAVLREVELEFNEAKLF